LIFLPSAVYDIDSAAWQPIFPIGDFVDNPPAHCNLHVLLCTLRAAKTFYPLHLTSTGQLHSLLPWVELDHHRQQFPKQSPSYLACSYSFLSDLIFLPSAVYDIDSAAWQPIFPIGDFVDNPPAHCNLHVLLCTLRAAKTFYPPRLTSTGQLHPLFPWVEPDRHRQQFPKQNPSYLARSSFPLSCSNFLPYAVSNIVSSAWQPIFPVGD